MKIVSEQEHYFHTDFCRSYTEFFIKTYILCVELPKTCKWYECAQHWIAQVWVIHTRINKSQTKKNI